MITEGTVQDENTTQIYIWVSAASLLKNNREGAHGQEPMKIFKMRTLMQEHRFMEMKSLVTSL